MDPDRELVERCQRALPRKNLAAFGELYEAYKNRVYNVTYRITGNATDALDAAQETFGILLRRIRTFRFRSKFSSWVYRIAVNAAIDLKRRGIGRRFPPLEGGSEGLHADSIDIADERIRGPVREAGARELEEEVQRAVSALSPKLRGIIVLRHVEGLSYEDISEVLRCSIGTVKSRLARAHAALETTLSKVLDRHFLD
jgi:RNA polymerase sigma-70 factor (ECF subfamily)